MDATPLLKRLKEIEDQEATDQAEGKQIEIELMKN